MAMAASLSSLFVPCRRSNSPFLYPVPSLKSLAEVSRGASSASVFSGEHGFQMRSITYAPKQGVERTGIVEAASSSVAGIEAPASSSERFRLGNLAPQPGSRKKNKRKGRGVAAGQGGSCGFGMRGQKSRSGPKVRPGFEGGQMPLYRRIPKLKGIAGGMSAGLPKHVAVNLKDIQDAGFSDGDEVSLETLKSKGVVKPTGRDRKLPLKVLGDGELSMKLAVKAGAFSASAKQKLEAAGCSLTTLPGRKKWVKPSVAKHQARADEYFARKRSLPSWSDKVKL